MAESRKKLGAEAWGSLLQVHAVLVPEFDRRVRDATGLPLAWYDVLLELASGDDGRLTMGQLGQRVVLSRSRVSRVVDDLTKAGLVRREVHPGDARSAYTVITEAGLTRFREAAPIYVSAIAEGFADLTAAELRAVRASMQKILQGHGERPPH